MIAPYSGRLVSIDNRKLATVAKLAGAPMAKAAGVALQCRLNQMVDAGAPLYHSCREPRRARLCGGLCGERRADLRD
jgi:thymidine phosphorylase